MDAIHKLEETLESLSEVDTEELTEEQQEAFESAYRHAKKAYRSFVDKHGMYSYELKDCKRYITQIKRKR